MESVGIFNGSIPETALAMRELGADSGTGRLLAKSQLRVVLEPKINEIAWAAASRQRRWQLCKKANKALCEICAACRGYRRFYAKPPKENFMLAKFKGT